MRIAIASSAIKETVAYRSMPCCRRNAPPNCASGWIPITGGNLTPIACPSSATPFLAVVDRDRNTIALINSIFDDFDSGSSADAGVIFHNPCRFQP
jgi:gamma-glutamyltranspeptidase